MVDRVSFEGVIHAGKKTSSKMTQYLALPGDVVISKIRARQGSVGLVTEGTGPVSVTIHYRVLKPDSTRVETQFLWHALRSSYCRSQFLAATGGAMKGEISERQLMRVNVPIPPLATQRAILDEWHKARMAIEETEAKTKDIEAQIPSGMLSRLGIAKESTRVLPKRFGLLWSNLERWSVEYQARQAAGMANGQSARYPVFRLDQLCDGKSGGTPSKRQSKYWNGSIPWVSPKDMKTFEISAAIDHITPDAVHASSAPLIPAGSVLIVVRSGILQRYVPIAVTSKDVSINQDMRAFVPRVKSIRPLYLAHYLNARQHEILRLVKWSTTVQSINREELDRFGVPVPPVDIQDKIADEAERLRIWASNERLRATRIEEQSKEDMEAYLLGTKKVPGS